MPQLNSLKIKPGAGSVPLDSQAIHLPPLTARSRNLVRFARHLPVETMDESFAGDFAFRDAGSRFSVLKSPKTIPGPDECFGVFARDARPLFRKLLGLELGYPGLDDARHAKLVGYNAMSYYRSHVVEYFCHNGIEPMPPVEGDCVLWFAAADVLRIRYRLWNKGAAAVPVRLAWRSESETGDGGQAEITERGWRFTARQHVGPDAYSHRCELLAEEDDLVFRADDDMIGSTPVTRMLPAGGTATLSFAVRFAFNDEPWPEWPACLWSDGSLASMAEQLGKNADATAWLVLADDLAAAINQWLIEPRTRTYQDRHIETGAFNGMVNLASFIPVYAGIAPPDVAEHLCRDYLLSPDHFLTDLPFPVIDRAHPTFRHGGFLHVPPSNPDALVQHSYWRGRTWIHGDTWYLGALWQRGFRREADELANRILTAVGRTEGICECYDSLTGFGNGHPEFMWSSAAVLLLAHGFYRQPPVYQSRRRYRQPPLLAGLPGRLRIKMGVG